MNAPEGATAKPSGNGVLVSKGEEFRLEVRPYEERVWKAIMDEGRRVLRQEGVQIIQDKEDILIGGTKLLQAEAFHAFVKVTVAGKPYTCFSNREPGIMDFTRAQAVLMAECAQSLTQTEANKQAEVRMDKAIARFNKLDSCKFSTIVTNTLNLKGEQVRDADLELLKDVPQIQHVVISAEKLTPAGLAHLQGLPNLEAVWLEGEAATDAWLPALKPLRLRMLRLIETAITSAGWKHLQEMETVKELKVRGQALDDEAVQHLAGMTQLTELELPDTDINDARLKRLLPLKNLEKLDLEGNPVTDAGLEHLTGFKQLLFLDIKDTKVTKAGVQKLKKDLSQCNITSDPE
jgi:hypothetical protein